MAAQLGGPVLLKQGYMQVKTSFGWKRQYYRLLQVIDLTNNDKCQYDFFGKSPSRSHARTAHVQVLFLLSLSLSLSLSHTEQDSLFSFNSHESKTPTDEVVFVCITQPNSLP